MVWCHDWHTGLRAVVAIDDTTLGPGLGGVRYARYPDEAAAVREAIRLARIMTLKNACADLPYGGAKSVVLAGDAGPPRPEVMRALGRFVGRLAGNYLPGVDMGTSVGDLEQMASASPDIVVERGDPSPHTALGVLAAITAALGAEPGDLRGRTMAVLGVGHVGAPLARLLGAAGASVVVADVDTARAEATARFIGGRAVPVADCLVTPCDVLAPCAGGGLLTPDTVGALGCRVVAGAANDVLAGREVAGALAARDVVYVPDFVTNAGGVIAMHAWRRGAPAHELCRDVLRIGDRVADLLGAARRRGDTPLEVAERRASERVGRPVRVPD